MVKGNLWLRLDKNKVYYKPTKQIYRILEFVDNTLRVYNFTYYSNNIFLTKNQVDNFDLKNKQVNLLYGKEVV